MSFMEQRPFKHLYIHIPFCATKCAYCAFYSAVDEEYLVENYLAKLFKEIDRVQPLCDKVESVFFGGGTPTMLEAKDLEQVMKKVYSTIPLADNAEISIESNPETLDDEKVRVISQYCTRMTMGVQSLNPEHRKTIGRAGSIQSIYNARELLAKHNFTNIGIDLIYAIPGQTRDEFINDMKLAVELEIQHISAYSLTVEEGTRLAADKCSEADDDISFEMWEDAAQLLKTHGFEQYEISNYAKGGNYCYHNKRIWQGDTYCGIGPSAVSFDGQDRFEQCKNSKSWIEGCEPSYDRIDNELRAREMFLMGLRTIWGWRFDDFMSQTGCDCRAWKDDLELYTSMGLVEWSEIDVKLSRQGLAYWNSIGEAII